MNALDQPTICERLNAYDHPLTAEEMSVELGVTKKTIFRQAAKRSLPSYKVGTCLRFDGPTVARWIAKQ